jgi:hypothetical protein
LKAEGRRQKAEVKRQITIGLKISNKIFTNSSKKRLPSWQV